MGDGAKERSRKGWEESGMNYGGSEGRGDSPIKAYLSGIYNYIMMHPLSHQVNWQLLFPALPISLLAFRGISHFSAYSASCVTLRSLFSGPLFFQTECNLRYARDASLQRNLSGDRKGFYIGENEKRDWFIYLSQ